MPNRLLWLTRAAWCSRIYSCTPAALKNKTLAIGIQICGAGGGPVVEVSKLIRPMRKRAPIYANRIQAHGQAMFDFAKRSSDWRWKGENPFEFDFESEEGRARDERLRPKDMPDFMKGLDSCSETMNLLFLTSLYTGRRIREVRAMQWDDLDLEGGIWHLPKTVIQ